MAGVCGVTTCSIAWFFLHYVLSPIEIYAALDQRLLQMNYVKTIWLAISLTTLFPAFIIICIPEQVHDMLTWWSWVPLLLSLCHHLFAFMVKDTTQHDRLHNVKADLRLIRRSTVVTGVISASAFIYLSYISDIGFPLAESTTRDFRFLGLHLGGMLWMVLLFRDLKIAKMIERRWSTLFICYTASTVLVGPSAALLAGWAWREEVLASQRHYAADTH